MIIGTHTVVASQDPEADHRFFREVLGLNAVDAGGGYIFSRFRHRKLRSTKPKGMFRITNFIFLATTSMRSRKL